MRRLDWTPDLVSSFWDGVARTRGLAQQSFGRLGGRHLLQAVRWHLVPGRRHLDFGGGDGDFAALLAAEGYPTAVYEPSAERAARVASRLSGCPGFLGTVGHEDDRQFDAIFLVEVIEHVLEADLRAVLGRLDRLLAPGGTIIISTPNNEDLEENFAFEPVQGVLFHRWQHQRSFLGATLSALMAAHGFAPRVIHEVELTDRIFAASGAGLGSRPEFANFFNTDRPLTVGDGQSLVWIGGRAGEIPADPAELGWRLTRLTVPTETRLVLPLAGEPEPPLLPEASPAPGPHGMSEFRILPRALVHDQGQGYRCVLPASLPPGDAAEAPERSKLLLMEEELPLGPGHAMHDRIRSAGHGRWSHWGRTLFFSSSDGSDPRSNGRHYVLRWWNRPPAARSGPLRFRLAPARIEPLAGRAFRVLLPEDLPPGDRSETDETGTLALYEGTLPLGPGHAARERIIEIGRGRFVQQGRLLLFSSSDGTDPRTNGRLYVLDWPAASTSEKPNRG
jgi:2-polyprenyl-3-methyl-5-hydroxy-6-metoxy-1,4-benzoquinol methylase